MTNETNKIKQLETQLAQEVAARHRVEAELRRAKARIENELKLAREIQYGLLPPPKPNYREVDAVCYTNPARQVGGDFYAYYGSSNPRVLLSKYIFIIGDVSGKGVSAALLMAACIAQIENSFAFQSHPAERLKHLDKCIMPYTKPHGQNCALCYAEITGANTARMVLKTINAGCIPPYIKRADGAVESPYIGGFALGQGLGMMLGYQETKIILHKGDMIILTSDGTVEAMNAAREIFGFERLQRAVENGPQSGAEDMLEHLKAEICAFVGDTEPHDDMTLIVVQV